MKTRPWALIVCAVVLLLAPSFSVLYTAWSFGASVGHTLAQLFQSPVLHVFESLFLLPLTGLAILRMRDWSYYIVLLCLFWSLWIAVRNFEFGVQHLSWILFVMPILIQFFVIAFFLRPSVRVLFFNPRLRWWETSPRYFVQTKSKVTADGKMVVGELVNISNAGLLLMTSEALKIDQELQIEFELLGEKYKLRAQIIRIDAAGFFGMRIRHSAESEEQVNLLIAKLCNEGWPDRDHRRPMLGEFSDWLLRFLKTGKIT